MKKYNGVSLIILVITIIVIIIIAGAVILSLSKNNPIGQANEAVFKQNIEAYSSEVSLYIASQYANTVGGYNPELLDADSTRATYNGMSIVGTPNIYTILPSLDPASADGNKFAIKKGKLIYVGTDSDAADWVEDVAMENLYVPKLTLTPKSAENKIRLDWSINDSAQPYTYKVYQQKEGDSTFQSISAINSKSSVKVLNVYPAYATTYTCTNWKGETFTLPQSAQTKMWMEQANVDDPKGYGKGILNVDAVELSVFNANPGNYLKNPDGSWKYDVVYEGAWDCNGACTVSGDNSNAARVMLQEFIASGRGLLMGHDTIYYGVHYEMNALRGYVNIKTALAGTTTNDFNTSAPGGSGTQIVTAKKGLLTNYPWNIGDVGTTLTIPSAHTSGQIAYGDVWMRFAGSSQPFNGGESNFYLTTWNNTAMIQLGHSNGAATADEQKLLANTLFYLAQLTTDTYLDDNSGQDLKAPSTPVISSATINGGTGKVDIVLTASTDLGSVYSYYVEATGQNNASIVKTNAKSTSITSGLAGYSIVVDTSPSTVPGNTVNLATTTTSITKPVGTDIYVHVKAIDNKGNVSSVSHLKAN